MIPDMKKVQSSLIEEIGYDPVTSTLWISFKRGKSYLYEGVPAETATKVMDAVSVGSAFHKEIRGKFESSVIPPAEDVEQT